MAEKKEYAVVQLSVIEATPEAIISGALDDEIRETIKTEWDENQHIICPHTACGEKVRRSYYADEPHSVVVATAHPAKFETIVEPLIDKTIPIPEKLYEIMRKPSKAKEIGTDYHQLFE